MGSGIYKGGASHHHSINENIKKLSDFYMFSNGYFGSRGDSTRESTRHIESSTPISTSINFYNKLTYGGIEKALPNGKGVVTKLQDGSIVSYRKISSSDGSPVVDINIKYSNNTGGVRQQKIHFVKKGK